MAEFQAHKVQQSQFLEAMGSRHRKHLPYAFDKFETGVQAAHRCSSNATCCKFVHVVCSIARHNLDLRNSLKAVQLLAACLHEDQVLRSTFSPTPDLLQSLNLRMLLSDSRSGGKAVDLNSKENLLVLDFCD